MDANSRFVLFIAIVAVVQAFITGTLGAWVAIQKGRSDGEGFLLGFLLSLYGVLLEALLPTLQARRRR